MFLLLPTSYSQRAITSIVLGAEIEGVGVNLAFNRALEQVILSAATECQVVSLSPRTSGGDPAEGEECPHAFCSISRSAGNEARVALVMVEGTTVSVWFSCIFLGPDSLRSAPGSVCSGHEPHWEASNCTGSVFCSAHRGHVQPEMIYYHPCHQEATKPVHLPHCLAWRFGGGLSTKLLMCLWASWVRHWDGLQVCGALFVRNGWGFSSTRLLQLDTSPSGATR